jgi:hypothetical protein
MRREHICCAFFYKKKNQKPEKPKTRHIKLFFFFWIVACNFLLVFLFLFSVLRLHSAAVCGPIFCGIRRRRRLVTPCTRGATATIRTGRGGRVACAGRVPGVPRGLGIARRSGRRHARRRHARDPSGAHARHPTTHQPVTGGKKRSQQK